MSAIGSPRRRTKECKYFQPSPAATAESAGRRRRRFRRIRRWWKKKIKSDTRRHATAAPRVPLCFAEEKKPVTLNPAAFVGVGADWTSETRRKLDAVLQITERTR